MNFIALKERKCYEGEIGVLKLANFKRIEKGGYRKNKSLKGKISKRSRYECTIYLKHNNM